MNNTIQSWLTLKKLLSYYKNHKKSLIFSCILMFFSIVTEILGPIIISMFLKNILTIKNYNYVTSIYLVFIFLILQIISASLNYIQKITFNKISISIIQKIRLQVMHSVLQQPMKIFDTVPIGNLVTNIINDTESIKEFYDVIISSILKNFILFFLILISMFYLDYKMALISSLMIPIVTLIMFIHQQYSKPIIQKIKNSITQLNVIINEMLNGIIIIQQFQQEKKFIKKIELISKKNYSERMKMLRLDGLLLRPLLSFISSIILVMIIMFFKLSNYNVLNISILYTFMNYLGRLNEPLISMANQQSLLQQAIVSSERIFTLLNSEKQTYGMNNLPWTTGEIEFKNVNFYYNIKEKKILHNINLKIKNNSFIALVGKTGSGKSTLAKLLMGYYPEYTGKIFLDKKDLKSLKKKKLRKNIAMVQQEPTILCDTFKQNITLGRKIKDEEILKIIKKVQLNSLVKTLPHNITTQLDPQGKNLSQGQKQLIGISRILVTRPKILIFDEATANIDAESEQKINHTLSEIKKYTTTIVIAHRLSTIINADKIIVLDQGKIIEQGSHVELLKKKGFYWKIYSFQLQEKNIF
ncbi:ABC transporter transmembrane domain-containing protein [Buchnera aphidicola]|uniref:ABC-type xenobiotic transporter n=1 Tax=Buchnera aphidicola subsp. Tuberolachnus salignus TaxID=98804 RepID=A0A160SYF2_BUCTT|nr:ABC transporter transmembrane domain-containing protein [Buchnera aphidicola]CUR53284.1 Multidrug resistance-like ATP-binding protein MdlB [Buchnera aphidicola (Tuberolachnus salignus)]